MNNKNHSVDICAKTLHRLNKLKEDYLIRNYEPDINKPVYQKNNFYFMTLKKNQNVKLIIKTGMQ